MRLDAIKLAVAMAKKGYNMISLAQACGVSRGTLSVAKAGKRIKPDTVMKIAKVLEVEMEELLED